MAVISVFPSDEEIRKALRNSSIADLHRHAIAIGITALVCPCLCGRRIKCPDRLVTRLCLLPVDPPALRPIPSAELHTEMCSRKSGSHH